MPGRFLFYSEVLLRLLPEQDYALHLEALAEALPLEVAATDHEGRVIVWNAALASHWGPRSEAVGRPLLDGLPWLLEDKNVDWAAMLADVLAGGEGQTLPRHPLGDRVVRATIAPMRGPHANVLGAVLCFEDITRGTREEERRRLQVRTDAVASLGAGIAHEIRNPLNALKLHLQLLRERLEDPAAEPEDLIQKTDTMIGEVDRMNSLVRNLLEVSRGASPYRRDESVAEIVRAVTDRLQDAAHTKGVTMVVEADVGGTMPLERTSIERAVSNLVENAIEAAGPGGTVWVTTRVDPHSMVVAIEDDGAGIPPEARERVFELFWTSKRGGTGLGLPLARRAVESHGGELEVLSRPGGGSRFLVHLPRRVGADGSASRGED